MRLILGDCVEEMAGLEAESIDAVVCDPPYELGFMGKAWDASGVAYRSETWVAALRVLKPGGHLVAFGGSRTYHRMACAVEDAGFEIRDQLMWLYGSGFPKSHNVANAIAERDGAERDGAGTRGNTFPLADTYREVTLTPEAVRWAGWGTALKPAHEPIVLARKPLMGTVAANVQEHGTGALNIDGCRIPTDGRPLRENQGEVASSCYGDGKGGSRAIGDTSLGRWPANVCLDEEAAGMLDQQTGMSSAKAARTGPKGGNRGALGEFAGSSPDAVGVWPGDSGGGASRFFYCAKASSGERNAGLEHLPTSALGESSAGSPVSNRRCVCCGHHKFEAHPCQCESPDWEVTKSGGGNHHPTVKPVDLMRWLCRLVTPPHGLILDPFLGSGTTGIAAHLESFQFVGIELDPDYMTIAEARIGHWTAQQVLPL